MKFKKAKNHPKIGSVAYYREALGQISMYCALGTEPEAFGRGISLEAVKEVAKAALNKEPLLYELEGEE